MSHHFTMEDHFNMSWYTERVKSASVEVVGVDAAADFSIDDINVLAA